MNVAPYLERYLGGEWRDRIFRDMIFDDVSPHGKQLTFLDIGCGRGFDNSMPLQESIARTAGAFIGVEPHGAIKPASYFTQIHQCHFEEAQIDPDSVDVAYTVMVLEHLADPQRFFDKLRFVLAPGSIFWGMTVDNRHWFASISRLLDRLKLKDVYLNALLGRREERYENYPVYYRSNSPKQICHLARRFAKAEAHNFSRVGQCSPYFPSCLRPLVDTWDRVAINMGLPGTLLFIRLQK